jgi:hypothetical protein
MPAQPSGTSESRPRQRGGPKSWPLIMDYAVFSGNRVALILNGTLARVEKAL